MFKWLICKFTKSNSQVFCNIDSVPRVDCHDEQNVISVYPPIPLQQSEQYEKPDDLGSNQEALLEHLIVDKAKLDTIEKKTSDKQPQIACIWRLRYKRMAGWKEISVYSIWFPHNCKKAKESWHSSKQSASSQTIYCQTNCTWENLWACSLKWIWKIYVFNKEPSFSVQKWPCC